MSDTPTTDETTRSRIRFSSDLEPRKGEEPLDEEEAAQLLAARLGVSRPRSEGAQAWNTVGKAWDVINPLPFGGHGVRDDLETDPAAFDLMVHLVRALPAEYRTRSVLTHVDVRPILSELILTEEQAARKGTVHYINDVPFAPAERVKAGQILVEQNEVIEEQAFIAATALEQQGVFAEADDPALARQQWIESAVNSWRTSDGELGATPGLISEGQEADTLETAEAIQEQLAPTSMYDQLLIDAGVTSGSGTAYQYLSEDDVQFMFRMNMVDWDALLKNERNKSEARQLGEGTVPGDLMVDHGGLLGGPPRRVDTGSLQGIADASAGRGGTRIRMLDVFNSLHSPNRTTVELRNLQDKLIAGGYLDEDDVRYWGRATDDATVSAWRTLVRDSINLGQDMQTVLKEQTLALRDKEEEESKDFQRDLVLSSSVGLQSMSDVLGQQVIGRKLSGDDHARLIEFIHSLERSQHETLDPDGGQVAEAIDVEAEVDAWIEREHGTEAGAYDLLEQFAAFNDIVRRPG